MEIPKDSSILVTGGNGFIGKAVCVELRRKGYSNVRTFGSSEYDLTKLEDVKKLFDEGGKFDVVMHLAGITGGVGYLEKNASEIFFKNLMMNTLLLEECRIREVKKFVGIGSAYSYPENLDPPFNEDSLWNGDVEEVTASYSLPKRMMLKQSQIYQKQHGMNAIHLLVTSVYGPGMVESRAITSMMKRYKDAVQSGGKEVTNWGTGKASRDLLYVEDAALAIVEAMEKYDKPEPINISSGGEVKMEDLAKEIAKLTGFEGEIIWDPTKPEGPKRVALDYLKAEKEFGFRAKTSFEEGLRKTFEWFNSEERKD